MFGKKKVQEQEKTEILSSDRAVPTPPTQEDGKKFGLNKVPVQFEVAIHNNETKTDLTSIDILVEIANKLEEIENKLDELTKLAKQ